VRSLVIRTLSSTQATQRVLAEGTAAASAHVAGPTLTGRRRRRRGVLAPQASCSQAVPLGMLAPRRAHRPRPLHATSIEPHEFLGITEV